MWRSQKAELFHYPRSIQSELFYTDSEKFLARGYKWPGVLRRPLAPKRSCLCVYACAYARVEDPRRGYQLGVFLRHLTRGACFRAYRRSCHSQKSVIT
jgi:hypothetical protein